MKILIIAPMLPQAGGPGAIPMVLHAQLQGLSARHEVSLVTGIGDEPWEADAAEAASSLAAHVYIADRRRPADVSRRTLRRVSLAGRWAGSRVPWRTLWFAPPAVQEAVQHALSETRFEVAAVEDSAMARVRLPRELPVVITDHEVVRARSEVWETGVGIGAAIRNRVLEDDWRRAGRFQASVWERYRRVQVFTQEEADAIAQLAPQVASRVRVNPFGIAIPPAADPAREEEDTVLFLGNFTHPPNRDAAHWLAEQIMPLVWSDRPAALLRLVGSAPPPDVTALAGPGIEVIADVPDTSSYLERAAVCAAPVRLGGGMRVKVLTALAHGKAVVTTSRGAQGFNSTSTGSAMLISDDAAGIASSIVALLADRQLRRSVGQGGRTLSMEQHSPEAWAARLERVYGEVARAAESVPEVAA